MKAIFAPLLLAGAASAHTIFSQVAVNGVWQGRWNTATNGLRLPNYDGPVTDVTSNDMTCNGGVNPILHKSNYKIPVKAGDSITLRWTHTLDSTPQTDPEDPVADGHNGPIMVYMAKVGDALTDTPRSGWFKIYEDGLANGQWAVQRLRANGGLVTVKIPECIAPGDYLFRGELIALHAAGSYPGAQFYMECAQFSVSSSGSTVPSNTVSLPGAYSGSDPGVKINLYYPEVTNYIIPGPRPFTCGNNGGGSNPTTTQPPRTTTTTTTTRAPVTTTTTTRAPVTTTTTTTQPPRTTTTSGPSGGAPLYGQCGGQGWTGPTTCAQGTCKVSNQWYSQCLN